MNRAFLLSIFTSLMLLFGCGEKLTNNAISFENPKESATEEPRPQGGVSEEELPPGPMGPLVLYPNAGYGRSGSGHHNGCARVEGNSCDTGGISPLNEGKIVCEQGQPVCKTTITELFYYFNIEDFIDSFIEIPTSNVLGDSSTLSSKYLAGRAPIYNQQDEQVGTCSASFLCMQNSDGIYTDISNHLSVDNGLILSWFTPTTLINLELDSIVNSMVSENIVVASTKILFNPFYKETFNVIVSSDANKIYFQLSRIEE